MELKIYNPQEGGYLKKIEWNFEELKEEVTAKAQEYARGCCEGRADRDPKETAGAG